MRCSGTKVCDTCTTPRGCPGFIARTEMEAFMAGWVARDANHLQDMPNALQAYLSSGGLAAGLEGARVAYRHPSWGDVTGTVLEGQVRVMDNEGGKPGPSLLVQDLSPNGAREWWPVSGLTVLGDSHAS